MSERLKNPHLEGEAFFWEGGKTGILLCHGFTATTAEVRPLARMLFEVGYTISAPLLPGHATTPEELNKVRWQDWLETMDLAYHELAHRCDQVIVGGESTGGLLALYLASQIAEIKAILAYAPALITTSPFLKFIASVSYRFLPYVPKKAGAPTHADNFWQGYLVNPVNASRQLFKLQSQVRARLNQVRQPILIVQGRKDPTVNASVPGLIAGSVQSSWIEIHWMDSSTHCVAIDCEYQQVAAFTIDFLKKAELNP